MGYWDVGGKWRQEERAQVAFVSLEPQKDQEECIEGIHNWLEDNIQVLYGIIGIVRMVEV